MSFILTTNFTDAALATLNATNSNVVVSKTGIGNGASNVAWIVFTPLETNTLSWEEEYGIYASTVSIQNGAVLTQMAATPFPAGEGLSYPFLKQGFFGTPATGGTLGSFTAVNQFDNSPPSGPGFMTIGLYQNAQVNGSMISGNAVSAASVPFLSTAVMTPSMTLLLWTQSQVVGNSVVTNVTSPVSTVTFGGPVTEISLDYDQESGMFIPAGGTAKLPTGVSPEHRRPALR